MTDTVVTVTAGTNSYGPLGGAGSGIGYYLGNLNSGHICGTINSPGTFHDLAIQVLSCRGTFAFVFALPGTLEQDEFDTLSFTDRFSGLQTLHSGSATFDTSTWPGYSVWSWTTVAALLAYGVSYEVTISDSEVAFNCDCEAESPYATLADLRISMMRRLGYSAMALNPPPGMTELLTDFLQRAQKLIDKKRPDLRTKRIFKWTMVPGERFYGFSADESYCGVAFDPLKVDWVGVEDLMHRWYPLIQGIPPTFYTMVNRPALPQRYEFRSCIEIFPTPNAAYTLRIKGDFGLTAFSNPEHKTTIDDNAVFLLALAHAKAHYKQADAKSVYQEYQEYLASMVSGKHGTAQYIPQKKNIPPAIWPAMKDGYNW